MIDKLLQPEVQQFIEEHLHDDVAALLLKKKEICGLPVSLVVDQITGKRKAREKLPLYFSTKGIVYPPPLNWSQCSSQQTAEFKARWISAELLECARGVDLTGGFGVDVFFIGKSFQQYTYVEANESLLQLSRHNHIVLGAPPIIYRATTAEEFIEEIREPFDFIYIDPSRRDNSNKKLFRLNECVPNVTILQKRIWQCTRVLLVKASPLLDIQQGLRELNYVKKIVILSVANECKELLFWCERDFNQQPQVEAINLHDGEDRFTFTYTEEIHAIISISEPKRFLYEPNASVLKAGAFKCIANRFQLNKLHANTHLYTSDAFMDDFPGRIFEINAFLKSDVKTAAGFFEEGKANIITRNYPLDSEQLKKKLRLNDGGNQYLLAFTGLDKKYLVKVNRIK